MEHLHNEGHKGIKANFLKLHPVSAKGTWESGEGARSIVSGAINLRNLDENESL